MVQVGLIVAVIVLMPGLVIVSVYVPAAVIGMQHWPRASVVAVPTVVPP